jgi:antirestriction protein ArdC
MSIPARPSTFELITSQITEALERGVVPWKMPWDQKAIRPKNVRGNFYRGINHFLLSFYSHFKGYSSPYWLTYKQAQEHGGNVKAGEKAMPVVFWKDLLIKDKDDDSDQITSQTSQPPSDDDLSNLPRIVRMIKHYHVFNIEQTEGVDIELPSHEIPVREFSPIEMAESIVVGYPNPPSIEHGGDIAVYSRLTDTVTLPQKEHFHSNEDYYDVLFHELGHSTAHPTRLNRSFSKNEKERAMEELIAELTSAFLCAESGISQSVIENEAAYIDNWLSYLKSDKTAFLVASGRAQKSADHILNKTFTKTQTNKEEAA